MEALNEAENRNKKQTTINREVSSIFLKVIAILIITFHMSSKTQVPPTNRMRFFFF